MLFPENDGLNGVSLIELDSYFPRFATTETTAATLSFPPDQSKTLSEEARAV